jgi:hypothetical protein
LLLAPPPLVGNASHYRNISIKAVAMDGTIQTNEGREPLLNPYDFFSINVPLHGCLRDPQVSNKLCVWCGKKECCFFAHSDEIMCAAVEAQDDSRIDAAFEKLRDDNRHVVVPRTTHSIRSSTARRVIPSKFLCHSVFLVAS